MRSPIKTFFTLSTRKRTLFFQLMTLSVQRKWLRLWKSPKAHTEYWVQQSLIPSPRQLSPAERAWVRELRSAIKLANKYIPWTNVCRHQAWQAAQMLMKHQIPFSYHVGINKTKPNQAEGHTWILVEGQFVTGDCQLEEYREIPYKKKRLVIETLCKTLFFSPLFKLIDQSIGGSIVATHHFWTS